jgi:hypothetical protein
VAIQSGVPVKSEGPPGGGKSAVHYALARALKRRYILLVGSCRAPEDFGGLPVPRPDEGFVTMMPTEWAAQANREPSLVHLDELTTVLASTQAPMLSILTERKCGDTQLRDDTLFAASCNPPAMATNGTPLAKSMANRFYHHPWQLDLRTWRDGLTNVTAPFSWADPVFPILPPNWTDHLITQGRLISGFLSKAPDRAVVIPDDDETMAFPTLRSWTNLGRVLAAAASVGAPDDVRRRMMEALIGKAVAVEFSAYCYSLDLFDPEDVLAGHNTWEWDDARVDRNQTFLAALFVAVKGNPTDERWNMAMDLLMKASRHCPEMALLYMDEALKAKPAQLMPSKALLKDLVDLRKRCSL